LQLLEENITKVVKDLKELAPQSTEVAAECRRLAQKALRETESDDAQDRSVIEQNCHYLNDRANFLDQEAIQAKVYSIWLESESLIK
jgi:TRAP-type mannitol/chloroaromatic compound transport system substrate-binding protein